MLRGWPASDLSYARCRSIAVVGEVPHGYRFRVVSATGCENPIMNECYLVMVAVRGQASVWPGFLIHSVSHPAYGCHLNP